MSNMISPVRRTSLPHLLAAIWIYLFAFMGCQPKAEYVTINEPMKDFLLNTSDSTRGAASVQELSCYFYSALHGDISFDQFARFIPDSGDIAQIYSLTNTSTANVRLNENADTIRTVLRRGFVAAMSKAAVLHASWSNATFDQVMVIEIEDQKLPSKKIIIICNDGKTTLRASAKCLQIGDRWFIGEDIRYGV
jgi:hypothetical protein